MNQILLVVCCFYLFVNFSLSAQEQEDQTTGEVEDAEILIIKDRQLTLPKQEKMFEKIRVPENQLPHEIRPNVFKPYGYSLQKSITKIIAAEPNDQKKDKLSQNYVRAGFGNFGSPLLAAGLFVPSDGTKILGINLNHLSFAKGAKDGKNSASSMSGAGVHGKLIGKKNLFHSALGFRSRTEYYYGYNELLEVQRDTIKQRLNFFNANIGLTDVNKNDDWNYDFSINFRNASNNTESSEVRLIAESKISYDQKFLLSFEVQTSTYKTAVVDFNRNYFRINPYYRIEIGELSLDAGLSYSVQNDTTSAVNESKVFPYLSTKYNLSNNLEAFASLDAGFQFNNYWDRVNENPYVNDALSIQNAEVKYDFEIGLRGNPIDKLGFELSFSTRSVKNKGFFINNPSDSAKFTLNYLTTPTKISTIEITSNYKLNDSNSLGFRLNYAEYSNKDGVATHVPDLSLELNGNHSLSNKLNLGWNFYSLSGIKALEISNGNEKMLSMLNLNVSGSYKIKENLTSFLNLNNVLNQNYQRFLNYEQQGFHFKAGFLYKF